MRQIIWTAFFLFISFANFSNDFSDFDLFQKKVSKEDVENKIQKYLVKDSEISSYFTISDQSLILFDAPKGTKERNVEYEIFFGEQKPNFAKKKNLKGLKIALDPGHFGGNFSRLEERFMYIPKNEIGNSETIQFNEGTLALLTAKLLKQMLEKEGAIVLLTRNKMGEGAIEQTFFSWLRDNVKLYESKKTLSHLFRNYYNRLDLIARADKINTFSPDLTVMIHYNAHHCESDKKNKTALTDQNYNLVFVPGAFRKAELSTKEDRYEFLRLILSDDVKQSVSLSRNILHQFEKKLAVPTIPDSVAAGYINSSCIKIEKGVFARNLSLTRRVRGALCYGESLIQNNKDECKKLGEKNCSIDSIACSSRLIQVASAYFEGIKSYLIDESL